MHTKEPGGRPPADGRLTLRGYARQRGCSPSAVVKALASGRIERDGAGLIDPEVAEAQWALNTGARIVTPLLRVAASPAELAVDRTWSPAAQRERLIARLAPGLVGADAETIAEALREAFTAGDDAQMIHLRHMLDEMCDELLPRP